MKALLNQARSAQKKLVDEDSQTISASILADPTKPFGDKVTSSFKGRISHRSSSIPQPGQTTAGIDHDLRFFITTTHDVVLPAAGAVLNDESGVQWTIGKTDPLRRFGGIYGFQADLKEVE